MCIRDSIETGAAAAAKGGFTTVVCMANTKPVVDNVETLAYVQEKGEKTPIHVPVSYTHLDVYKRQVETMAARFILGGEVHAGSVMVVDTDGNGLTSHTK